ncbi:MAG: DNA polymerase III subunit delta' [Colwellia sp.]
MLPVCREKQSQLSRQYQQGTLAHAIIIQGIEGSGNDALAHWLIELLICQAPLNSSSTDDVNNISLACGQCKTCLLRKSGSYPDHLLLNSENKSLGIDDIRRGNTFLQKTAHLGRIKTILIPQAQLMTVAAANALLKTLEEPNAGNYIVLITEDLDSLLPTIISRCSIYTIRPMVGEALLAQLNISTHDDATTNGKLNENAFVNLSQLPELTDETIFKAFQAFNQCYLSYLNDGENEAELLTHLVDNKHSVRWLEKITCNIIRQYYIKNQSDLSEVTANEKISIQTYNQIYQTIIKSNKLIKSYTQANRQFVDEQLLMTISGIVRPLT